MGETKEEPKELSKIVEILKDIRNHDDSVEDLVEELEVNVTNKGTQYRDFCKAYTVIIVKEYCSTEDEAELMLAAYGLLKGFEFKKRKLTDRLIRYWKYSRSYNSLLEDINEESAVAKVLSNRIEKIINNMDEKITTAKLKTNNGRLGLISRVPEVFSFVEPRCQTQSKELSAMDEIGEEEDNNISDSVLPEEEKIGKQDKSFDCWVSKYRKREIILRVIVAILVICLIFLIYSKPHFIDIEESKVIDNSDPLLVRNIGVANLDTIILAPGRREKLSISIYPEEADRSSVFCIPDDPKVAYILKEKDDLYVVGQSGQEGNGYSETIITIQGGLSKHVERKIIIRNDVSDGNNSLEIGSGEQNDLTEMRFEKMAPF